MQWRWIVPLRRPGNVQLNPIIQFWRQVLLKWSLAANMNQPRSKQSGYLGNISFGFGVILLNCNYKLNSPQALIRNKESEEKKKRNGSRFWFCCYKQAAAEKCCSSVIWLIVSSSLWDPLQFSCQQWLTISLMLHCTASKSWRVWLHQTHEENGEGQSSLISQECGHLVKILEHHTMVTL